MWVWIWGTLWVFLWLVLIIHIHTNNICSKRRSAYSKLSLGKIKVAWLLMNSYYCSSVCLFLRARWLSSRRLVTKAKLPMQKGAVKASNKLLHAIWMRPELPAEHSGVPRVCLALTASLSLMSVMDLTLWGVLARWIFLFVALWLHPGSVSIPSTMPTPPLIPSILPCTTMQSSTLQQNIILCWVRSKQTINS